ncbi:DUF3027 domain-containing protein [Agrococcus sp. ProA11]|uniref:DUF3027 domain-containing protein n=1 Tax=Agrococcus chionoecetis TaxID=3153752 RepID=UPI003260BE0C
MTSTPESDQATEPVVTEEQSTPASEPAASESAALQPTAPTTPTAQELELAMAALDEVAPRGAVGQVQDARAEGGADGQAQVVAIRHASTLAGYPDWSWTVLLSRGVEGGPTVLEVALLPGDTSLLAPSWVPWTDRLADYLAAKDADEVDDDADLDAELESDLESDLEDDFDDDFVEDDFDEADDADDAEGDGRD